MKQTPTPGKRNAIAVDADGGATRQGNSAGAAVSTLGRPVPSCMLNGVIEPPSRRSVQAVEVRDDRWKDSDGHLLHKLIEAPGLAVLQVMYAPLVIRGSAANAPRPDAAAAATAPRILRYLFGRYRFARKRAERSRHGLGAPMLRLAAARSPRCQSEGHWRQRYYAD